jgi:hypothetical protein
MKANYRETKTDFTEKLSAKILSELGLSVKRNNLQNKTAVDLIVENKIKMDVQYSQDFKKWGDFRVDFVSAYLQKNYNVKDLDVDLELLDLFSEFEKRFDVKIVKPGKYFQKDYVDGVIILFYNEKLNLEEKNEPDFILIVSKKELINYLKKYKEKLIKEVKLNDKSGLGDRHGSAFLPIKVAHLVKNSRCIFTSLEQVKKNKDNILSYIRSL